MPEPPEIDPHVGPRPDIVIDPETDPTELHKLHVNIARSDYEARGDEDRTILDGLSKRLREADSEAQQGSIIEPEI